MYCLNYRIGIVFRQNLQKKSYQLRYFFIDDEANIFYVANLPKLQKILRLSKDLKEIKTKLVKIRQKSFNLNSYNILAPKSYITESVLPFCNRTCIEIRQKEIKDQKQNDKNNEKTSFMLLGLMDQDTLSIYEQILYLTGKKKKQIINRKIIQEKIQDYSQQKVFDSFIQCGINFSMNGDKPVDSQYDGEEVDGRAQGKGKQILVSKGMTYSGVFREGKKHGRGYLVNKNLDTMECQFLEDQLAGI